MSYIFGRVFQTEIIDKTKPPVKVGRKAHWVSPRQPGCRSIIVGIPVFLYPDAWHSQQIQYKREKCMNNRMNLKKAAICSAVCVMSMAGIAAASNVAVGVDVNSPNVRVRVGTPAPPPPVQHVTVVEHERVIVRDRVEHHDRGKHKGHYKKHKKHKNHDH